tara:strand:+ start:2312 stop:2890 length:579 start_codon:yes stop_codon:yes gene_type:complete
MGTRSYIGYSSWDEDGITASYCHYDGYLQYNGLMLYGFYSDIIKVRRLVGTGYISSLELTTAESNTKQQEPEKYEDLNSFMKALSPLHIEYVYLFIDKPQIDAKGWFVARSDQQNNGFFRFGDEEAFFHTCFKPLGHALKNIELPDWYDSWRLPKNWVEDSKENVPMSANGEYSVLTSQTQWHVPTVISDHA